MSLNKQKLDQIDVSIIQLQALVPAVQEYINNNLEDLIKSELLPEMRLIAQAVNVPQKFIDGIKHVMVSKNTFKIINTWGTRDKPLALWFNYGTKKHFIAPLGPWPLHWITPEGKHAYSKGHMVRGVPQTLAMELGIDLGVKRLIAVALLKCKKDVSMELGL